VVDSVVKIFVSSFLLGKKPSPHSQRNWDVVGAWGWWQGTAYLQIWWEL